MAGREILLSSSRDLEVHLRWLGNLLVVRGVYRSVTCHCYADRL